MSTWQSSGSETHKAAEEGIDNTIYEKMYHRIAVKAAHNNVGYLWTSQDQWEVRRLLTMAPCYVISIDDINCQQISETGQT